MTAVFLEFSPDKKTNATLLVIAGGIDQAHAAELVQNLAAEFHVLVYSADLPNVQNVWRVAETISAEIDQRRIKRLTLFGRNAGGSLAQALTLVASRTVGRLVLIDPTCRQQPTAAERTIDYIERHLPCGLPFRKLSSAFDSRPFLQRIYCPTLVMVSSAASHFVKEQAQEIADAIPNAWLCPLEEAVTADKVSAVEQVLLREFINVPTKRPQKNL